MRSIEEIKADIAIWDSVKEQNVSSASYTSLGYTDQKLYDLQSELRVALTAGTPIDELEALMTAKREGRVAVLPCKEVYSKTGDTLFLLHDGEIVEVVHCGAQISANGELYVICAADDKIFPYREPDAEHDTDPTDWCTNAKNLELDDFGKTVFLTPEAAEAALEQEGQK